MRSKGLIIFFAILTCAQTLTAQTTNFVVGKWKFKKVANEEGVDSVGLKMLRKFFGDATIYLKPNKHYKSFIIVKEEGTWSYEESSKKLTLTANKGTISNINVDLIDTETLVLIFDKKKSLIMERVNPTPEDEIEEANKLNDLVSISTTQLCKKWYLISRDKPTDNPEIVKKVTDLFKGSFFNFKTDKTYDLKIGQIEETGTWVLENENKIIVLTVGNDKKFWKIKKVTENELMLIKGNSEEVLTFSTKEVK